MSVFVAKVRVVNTVTTNTSALAARRLNTFIETSKFLLPPGFFFLLLLLLLLLSNSTQAPVLAAITANATTRGVNDECATLGRVVSGVRRRRARLCIYSARRRRRRRLRAARV